MTVYQEIFEVIKQRKTDYEAGKAQENSYTAYLFDKGVDKICKRWAKRLQKQLSLLKMVTMTS